MFVKERDHPINKTIPVALKTGGGISNPELFTLGYLVGDFFNVFIIFFWFFKRLRLQFRFFARLFQGGHIQLDKPFFPVRHWIHIFQFSDVVGTQNPKVPHLTIEG